MCLWEKNMLTGKTEQVQSFLGTGTNSDFCTVVLQRLANPSAPYDPVVNPYRTVDWMPVDLTVYNGDDKQPYNSAQPDDSGTVTPPTNSIFSPPPPAGTTFFLPRVWYPQTTVKGKNVSWMQWDPNASNKVRPGYAMPMPWDYDDSGYNSYQGISFYSRERSFPHIAWVQEPNYSSSVTVNKRGGVTVNQTNDWSGIYNRDWPNIWFFQAGVGPVNSGGYYDSYAWETREFSSGVCPKAASNCNVPFNLTHTLGYLNSTYWPYWPDNDGSDPRNCRAT